MSCFVHPDKDSIGHCVDCGKSVCLVCLNKEGGRIFCDMCARIKADQNQMTTRNSQKQSILSTSGDLGHVLANKNPGIAAVLAFLFGSFGVHKFYLGEIGWGIAYFLFSWTGIPFLAGLVEGIIYLTQSEEEFAFKYGARSFSPRPSKASQSLPSTRRHALPKTAEDYERFLMRFAQEHQGVITVSQVVAESQLSIEKVEEHLATLAGKSYARSEMDPDTGRVTFVFPEFQNKYLN